jgi:hypothetical protein
MEFCAGSNRHVSDEDSMLLPEGIDLVLAEIDEMLEVPNEKDAFTRVVRRTPAPDEDIVRALRRRKLLSQVPLGNDFEAGQAAGVQDWRVHLRVA